MRKLTISPNYRHKTYIDGKFREKSPCAYCWSKAHRGYLTTKMVKEHKCLEKQCPCLQKYEEHGYWVQKEKRKEEKRRRKELLSTV